jgi:hypothetical protein
MADCHQIRDQEWDRAWGWRVYCKCGFATRYLKGFSICMDAMEEHWNRMSANG